MISTKVVTITPAKAREILKRNTVNRPLIRNHINELAEAIKANEWQLNGETIKISSCNTLLDGQHRLSAVVKTGSSIKTLVTTGLDLDSFHTINTGARVRTASDVLAIRGEKNHLTLAAGIRIFSCWESNPSAPQLKGYRVRSSEIESVLKRHPEIRRFVAYKAQWMDKILTRSVVCSLAYIFHGIDWKRSDAFFEGLAMGTGYAKSSSIHLLREILLENKSSRAKLSREDIIALVIKAWNAYHDGIKLSALKFAVNEKFPIISGVK